MTNMRFFQAIIDPEQKTEKPKIFCITDSMQQNLG